MAAAQQQPAPAKMTKLGSRLTRALPALPARAAVILFQEVRPPRGMTWASRHGYLSIYAETNKRNMCDGKGQGLGTHCGGARKAPRTPDPTVYLREGG